MTVNCNGFIGASSLVSKTIPSPNCVKRPSSVAVQFCILHATWMQNDAEALQLLCDPLREVSSHYFIEQNGNLIQLVSEDFVAWHAGNSKWGPHQNLNPISLGIEIGNAGPFKTPPTLTQEASAGDWSQAKPFLPIQYQTLISLLQNIFTRYPNMGPASVLGHSDIAPNRKSDPGPHFNWSELSKRGLALNLPHKFV